MENKLKKVVISSSLKAFFSDQKGMKALEHLNNQLPTYVLNPSGKLKKIHGIKEDYFELKIKKGCTYYRLAFKIESNLTCFYLSSTLKKKPFDLEVSHYLRKKSRDTKSSTG